MSSSNSAISARRRTSSNIRSTMPQGTDADNPPLRHPGAMPLVVWRHSVGPTDGHGVATDREPDTRTHDPQGFPVDLVDGVPRALKVRVVGHARLASPQPGLHGGF